MAALMIIAAPSFAYSLPSQVKVRLTALTGARSVIVTCPRQLRVVHPADGSVVARVEPGSAAQVSLMGKEISVTVDNAAYRVSDTCEFRPSSPDAFVEVARTDGKAAAYRGTIAVECQKSRLGVSNIVDVEDYLKGVVPLEMPASYPEEALKAQAVAARTYVYLATQRLPKSGRELCDGSHCQRYMGVAAEKPRCDKAIRDTAGQVLTHGGALASTMYCADSGGTSANYRDYYPEAVFPYLTSVRDPKETRHIQWRAAFPAASLVSRLAMMGITVGPLPFTTVSVTKADAAGRAIEVEFATAGSKAAVPAQKLRAVLGTDAVKSTAFTMSLTEAGDIRIEGKGYGHGFGMSQRGAGAMASPPNNQSWRQILAHYYPGAEVVSVGDLRCEGAMTCGSTKVGKGSSATGSVR